MVPTHEHRHGLEIDHPRYLVIPKIGMRIQATCLYWRLARHVKELLRQGIPIDLIDAHYFYPDGAAAVRLGRDLGVPVCVTARGTDINLYPDAFPEIRRAIIETAERADAVIAVCKALKDALVDCDVAPDKVTVLRNGVDLEAFRPLAREMIRQELGLHRPTILSVGYLIERKGHHLVIEALRRLPEHDLLIVGEGPDRGLLERVAQKHGVAARVRFLGSVPYERMPSLYNAVDLLVLASSREGWANVLLEAMACGTPVVATNIWGTPEVVASPAAGRLVPTRDAGSLSEAIQAILKAPPSRAATRAYAENFSWQATTDGQLKLFSKLVGRRLATTTETSPCPAIS